MTIPAIISGNDCLYLFTILSHLFFSEEWEERAEFIKTEHLLIKITIGDITNPKRVPNSSLRKGIKQINNKAKPPHAPTCIISYELTT